MLTAKDLGGTGGPTSSLAATNRYSACTAWVRLEQMEPWPGVPGKVQGQRPLNDAWVTELSKKFSAEWFVPTVFPMVGVACFEDAELPAIPAPDSAAGDIPTLDKTLRVYNISGNHRAAAAKLYFKEMMQGHESKLQAEKEKTIEITDDMVLAREDARWPMLILKQGKHISARHSLQYHAKLTRSTTEILQHPEILEVMIREYNVSMKGRENTIKETWEVICTYTDSHKQTPPPVQYKQITYIVSLCAHNDTYTNTIVRCATNVFLREIIRKLLAIPAFDEAITLNTFKTWCRAGERGVS